MYRFVFQIFAQNLKGLVQVVFAFAGNRGRYWVKLGYVNDVSVSKSTALKLKGLKVALSLNRGFSQ